MRPDGGAAGPARLRLSRQEMRRLREIADGRVYATICWPRTFERLIDLGYAERVESRVTSVAFARITDAGRAALGASAGGSDG